MQVKDFVFDKISGGGYCDYWFRIVGDTQKELTRKYMEQSMIAVTHAVFSLQDGQWGIRRQFPFSYDVIAPDDRELYETIKQVAFGYYQANKTNLCEVRKHE